MRPTCGETRTTREQLLTEQFGALLSMTDVAQALGYPSVAAVRKARSRGALPVPVMWIEQRRGWFATARAVSEYLDCVDAQANAARHT